MIEPETVGSRPKSVVVLVLLLWKFLDSQVKQNDMLRYLHVQNGD